MNYFNSPKRIVLLFLIMTLGVVSFIYFPKYQTQKQKAAQLAAVLGAQTEALSLDPRTKTSGCVLNGALPDHACTPGAVFADATVERICVSGYTTTVRNVPLKLRKSLFAAYGVVYPPPSGAYELDHFIPLALGGNNDAANLFPEPASPVPGFKEKDVVEIYLYQEVCASRVSLPVAQAQISKNWLAIYNNLSPDQIARIKSKYKSWSN